MSEIEKMKRYIERTKPPIKETSPYQMSVREALAVSNMPPVEAVGFAFQYGLAKGCRAAKAERGAAV